MSARAPVKTSLPSLDGTEYFARDIVNINETCNWSILCYGVDMDKPGAREYYNSVVELAASWGVDLFKYDDIDFCFERWEKMEPYSEIT